MSGLADLMCPESCAGCSRPARGGLCLRCLGSLPRINGTGCACCGRPGSRPAPRCRDCRGRRLEFDLARQAVEYDRIVRTAIHRFKYSGCRSLGKPLAALVAELAAVHAPWPDALTWVCPSPERLRRTGTDHGRVLAEQVAGRLGRPAVPMLTRVRRTAPQMKLDPDARRSNLAGAFRCTTCPPPEVVVVDDVFTTGSTASEAARALKAAGAERVAVLCVARSFAPDPGAYN
ncbi:MAG TPA: ComF family protein [Actinomycetota bacterium]|nr:ComF family protein [Actinomycetota bacterium]